MMVWHSLEQALARRHQYIRGEREEAGFLANICEYVRVLMSASYSQSSQPIEQS